MAAAGVSAGQPLCGPQSDLQSVPEIAPGHVSECSVQFSRAVRFTEKCTNPINCVVPHYGTVRYGTLRYADGCRAWVRTNGSTPHAMARRCCGSIRLSRDARPALQRYRLPVARGGPLERVCPRLVLQFSDGWVAQR
jgi:hypothetical protein